MLFSPKLRCRLKMHLRVKFQSIKFHFRNIFESESQVKLLRFPTKLNLLYPKVSNTFNSDNPTPSSFKAYELVSNTPT